MGSPFPIVYAEWSFVCWFFATSSQRLKTALNFVYNNNLTFFMKVTDFLDTNFDSPSLNSEVVRASLYIVF